MKGKSLELLELDAIFACDKNITDADINYVVKHDELDMLEMINKLSMISESREKVLISEENQKAITQLNKYKSLGSNLSGLKEALDKARTDRTNRAISLSEPNKEDSPNYYEAYGDKQMIIRLLAELSDTDNYKISVIGDDSNIESMLNAITQKAKIDKKSVWMIDRTKEDDLKF